MVTFLVIRFSSIGDIVLTTPVIRNLKNSSGDVVIHYITKPAFMEILEANPYIDHLHILDEVQSKTTSRLKEIEFDYIIDLQNNFRSMDIKKNIKRIAFTVDKLNFKKWLLVNLKINRMPDLHIVDRYMATIKPFVEEADDQRLEYFLKEKDKVSLADLPPAFSKGFIAFVIGARHETKKLPPGKIIEILNGIKQPVILIGGPEDHAAAENLISHLKDKPILNGCGKWSINQSASVISQANVVLTHDTGMMHIAAAFGKKIITIWGNTIPDLGMYAYKADPASLNFEINDLKCRPCSKLGKTSCPKKHFDCMMKQDTSKIAEEANRLFTS